MASIRYRIYFLPIARQLMFAMLPYLTSIPCSLHISWRYLHELFYWIKLWSWCIFICIHHHATCRPIHRYTTDHGYLRQTVYLHIHIFNTRISMLSLIGSRITPFESATSLNCDTPLVFLQFRTLHWSIAIFYTFRRRSYKLRKRCISTIGRDAWILPLFPFDISSFMLCTPFKPTRQTAVQRVLSIWTLAKAF